MKRMKSSKSYLQNNVKRLKKRVNFNDESTIYLGEMLRYSVPCCT